MAYKPISEQIRFWDHIEELRIRLIRSIIGVLIGSVLGLFFSKQILNFLTLPFKKSFPETSLVVISPIEGFSVYFLVGIASGIVFTLPWVFYQLWGFVSPALKKSEKRIVLPLVLISTTLFLVGAIFAWWLLPRALVFLGKFPEGNAQVFWSLNTYITFIVLLIVSFGVMFQLPLIMAVLIRLGIATPSTFRKQRRISYVIILILSAIITPTTDIFTLAVLSIPLMLMYEISILIGSIWKVQSER